MLRGRQRQQRSVYSVEQRDELERFFQNNHYPSYEERETLAARLNLQENQVQVPPNPIPRLGDHRPPALPLGRRWGGRGASGAQCCLVSP